VSWDESEVQELPHNLIMDKVVIHLDVLHAPMENWIRRVVLSPYIVSPKSSAFRTGDVKYF
jgi:hypothetical protein